MSVYSYCVNTFSDSDDGLIPVQLSGTIEASDKGSAIKILKDTGRIYSKGYEFLELKMMKG